MDSQRDRFPPVLPETSVGPADDPDTDPALTARGMAPAASQPSPSSSYAASQPSSSYAASQVSGQPSSYAASPPGAVTLGASTGAVFDPATGLSSLPSDPPSASVPTVASAGASAGSSAGSSAGTGEPPTLATTAAAPAIDVHQLTEEVRQSSAFLDDVFAQVGRVVVGQRDMVERVMIGLLTGGHCLIEGVPGLAKTLMVKTLSQTIAASFQRIQFTPDLLPADITGTIIYNMHTGQFTQKRGPLFANLVLADEVNRAPAKVQSALLEAMQERQVTIGDTTHPLPDPFLVLATQNPIEQEGTFPLPEAQLDRFMLLIKVSYPTASDERAMLDRMSTLDVPAASEVASVDQVRQARRVVGKIYIDDRVRDYIVHVVQATRKPRDYGLGELAPLIEYGASPRATLCLASAARAHAFIRHRAYVTPDDIKAIAMDVLRHRVTVTYEAEAEEVTSEDVVRRIFEYLPVP